MLGFLGGVGEDAATRMEGRGRGARMEEGGIYGLGVREVELVKSCRGGEETGDARQVEETEHTRDLDRKQVC